LICLLYPDVLCLACAGKADPIYTIKACINVHELNLEEADNGRGEGNFSKIEPYLSADS
jgi:hypothetical protein